MQAIGVYLLDPNKPDEIIYTASLPLLLPYANTRIHDIIITETFPTPPDPCEEEMEQYRTQCKNYPGSTHCLPSGDCNCDLPLEGDYEGDYDGNGLTNQEEVCFYNTSPLLPTIILPLSRGMHLLYLPSILDKRNIITKVHTSSSYNVYYYDPTVTNWKKHEGKILSKSKHFYALDCPEPALLCLDLKPGNSEPVLYFDGCSGPDFHTLQSLSDSEPDQELLDAGCFSPDMSTHKILSNPDCFSIEMINGQNPRGDRWESSYCLFGKPSGQDFNIQPYAAYIVTRKKRY